MKASTIKPSPTFYALLFFIGSISLISMVYPFASHAKERQASATFIVDSELDAVDSNLGDGVCQTAEGTCTLRAAIQEANTSDTPDEITIPSGTFTLSILGTKENEAAFGDLDITNPLTINGAGSELTIISGNKIERVFHNLADTTISNLTIRDGFSQDDLFGGAIHNAAPLVLQSVVITSNVQANPMYQSDYTDAIYTTADLAIYDTLVANNHTGLEIWGTPVIDIKNSVFRNNVDGAIRGRRRGSFDQPIQVTMRNSEIIENTSSFRNAGIYLSGATLIIDQSKIQNNRNSINGATGASGNSGGLFIGEGNLVMTNSIISNNFTGVSTNSHGGGGISIYNSVALIKNTTIENNTSEDGPGGGILISDGILELVDSAVINNQARSGAGIEAKNRSKVEVLNSTISGNVADAFGGGLFNGDYSFENDISVMLIGNSTIANNRAEGQPEFGEELADGVGGGLWNSGIVFFYHSVLANNSADQGADCYSKPVMISLGYNLIEDGSPCPISGETATDILGTDPLLMDLADNGGDTMTHLPQAGSPLIDAGNPAGCFDVELVPLGGVAEISDQVIPFDQRGFYRTVDGNDDAAARCDIGAVEALSDAPILDQIIFLPMIKSD